MNDDCLKLTTYFGERDRANGGFLADAFTRSTRATSSQTSLVLRGVEGFGAKHQLRTDRLLTLSEDLPLVSVAVDTSRRIQAALREIQALRFDGLVTLERARMLTGEISAVELPPALHEATKLTVYVGRQERVGRHARLRGGRRSAAPAAASPARPCCSASTAPPTACASARSSSGATRRSRS